VVISLLGPMTIPSAGGAGEKGERNHFTVTFAKLLFRLHESRPSFSEGDCPQGEAGGWQAAAPRAQTPRPIPLPAFQWALRNSH